MPQSRKLQQHMLQLSSTLSLRPRCSVSWLIFACDLLLERLKALLHLLLQQQQRINVLLLPLQNALQVRNLRLGPLFDQPVLIPAHTSRASDKANSIERIWRENMAGAHSIILYTSLASAPSYGA